MKKHFLLILFALLSSVTLFAQDQVLGKWLSPDKDGHIEMYKVQNKFYGKIVWAKDANKKDDKNPDDKLRSRLLLGSVIFTDFEYKNSEWVNGKIYDPVSGKKYIVLQ